jgi:hypothetical protein
VVAAAVFRFGISFASRALDSRVAGRAFAGMTERIWFGITNTRSNVEIKNQGCPFREGGNPAF